MDMELRNVQQIEERKYQVEMMRLETQVEELKREPKKKQQVLELIEPRGAIPGAGAAQVAQPALTFALKRVRARCVVTAKGAAAVPKLA